MTRKHSVRGRRHPVTRSICHEIIDDPEFDDLGVCGDHCGHTTEPQPGYDDAHYHNNVIPNGVCPDCRKTASAPSSYPDVPAHIHI